MERTRGKAAGGGPGRVSWQLADWEKQWLVDWAGKAVVGEPGMSHIHVPINKEEQLRIETLCNPGFQHREIKPQNL